MCARTRRTCAPEAATIFATERKLRISADGFRLVCSTVEHLVAELRRVRPTVERAIADGVTSLDALVQCRDYEVIP